MRSGHGGIANGLGRWAITPIVFVLAVCLFLVSGCSDGKSETARSAQAATAADMQTKGMEQLASLHAKMPKETSGFIFTTPKVMYTDFSENEVAANRKYKGKFVAIEGKVQNVVDTPERPTISLAADEVGFAQVVVHPYEYQVKDKGKVQTALDLAATLSRGQKVVVVGVCEGVFLTFPKVTSALISVR